MTPHLLYIGGEDHYLRIPAMLALRDHGIRVTAAGTGDAAPFVRAGIDYRRYCFERFINPLADWAAIKTVARLLLDVRPDIAQSFDTKPSLLLPLAARGIREVLVIRTITGRAWLYSSRSPLALALRPVYRALHRLAARSTAATVFQNHDDLAYFERHRMVGRGAIRVIPEAVDIDGFSFGPPSATGRALSARGTARERGAARNNPGRD